MSHDFAASYAEWRSRSGKVATAEEQPGTWMITRAGYYFPFKGGLRSLEEQRQRWDEMCCLYQNTTSMTMAGLQYELRRTK